MYFQCNPRGARAVSGQTTVTARKSRGGALERSVVRGLPSYLVRLIEISTGLGISLVMCKQEAPSLKASNKERDGKSVSTIEGIS